jgi:hypothetical protein
VSRPTLDCVSPLCQPGLEEFGPLELNRKYVYLGFGTHQINVPEKLHYLSKPRLLTSTLRKRSTTMALGIVTMEKDKSVKQALPWNKTLGQKMNVTLITTTSMHSAAAAAITTTSCSISVTMAAVSMAM